MNFENPLVLTMPTSWGKLRAVASTGEIKEVPLGGQWSPVALIASFFHEDGFRPLEVPKES